ncbi:hypothetical protein Tco_0342666, partial [Tanacetum coccineum]
MESLSIEEYVGEPKESELLKIGINGDSNATRENQERFKAMDVNDGLGNLDDYLILYDDPHYVEKEERRFKERVTIIEYEQDVLLQPNESMPQAYERIFHEMNK